MQQPVQHVPVSIARRPSLALLTKQCRPSLLQGGYTQAALLYITLPIYLLKFDT